MAKSRGQRGFSLTETLIAIAILAIGMVFIAGVFPVGIHFTTMSTERSIAAVVADEAFSKIRLHKLDFANWPTITNPDGSLRIRTDVSVPFSYVALPPLASVPPAAVDFFAYPSRPLTTPNEQKQYFWSAICRVADANEQVVQVTVFVSRKIGSGTLYYERLWNDPQQGLANDRFFPMAIWVWAVPEPQAQSEGRELVIYKDLTVETHPFNLGPCVNDGSVIVEGTTGRQYRVLEKLPPVNLGGDPIVVLDRAVSGTLPRQVWVVPPPVGGGRNPCIGVFQKEIRF